MKIMIDCTPEELAETIFQLVDCDVEIDDDDDDKRELPNPDELLFAIDLVEGNPTDIRLVRKVYKKQTP